MIAVLSLLAGILLGALLYRLIAGHVPEEEEVETPEPTQPGGLIEAQAEEKQLNLARIIKLFEGKDRITNDDVENLLKVSDATATNYLDELEEQDKIRQVGKTGTGVYYELINT